ncbi:MAG: acyl-CoA thioesterase [Ignavibacteria bacterium]
MLEIKDKNAFKHMFQVRVRTWEVDFLGVVHNSNYLRFMETGRLEYRRNYGYELSPGKKTTDGLKVFVAHNSIDYLSTAAFDDLLNIYTRVAWIKNSSFCFEHIIEKDSDKSILAKGMGIIVNVDYKTNRPADLPDKFVNEIMEYETDCKLMR